MLYRYSKVKARPYNFPNICSHQFHPNNIIHGQIDDILEPYGRFIMKPFQIKKKDQHRRASLVTASAFSRFLNSHQSFLCRRRLFCFYGCGPRFSCHLSSDQTFPSPRSTRGDFGTTMILEDYYTVGGSGCEAWTRVVGERIWWKGVQFVIYDWKRGWGWFLYVGYCYQTHSVSLKPKIENVVDVEICSSILIYVCGLRTLWIWKVLNGLAYHIAWDY